MKSRRAAQYHAVTLLCGIMLASTLVAADRTSNLLSPSQDYAGERRNPVEYELDFSVVVTPPYHAKVLKVWLPLPSTNAGQKIHDRSLSTFPMQVEPQIGREPLYGNQFAYFEFREPKGAQIIRHRFHAKVWDMRWGVEPDKVLNVEEWPTAFPHISSTTS